MQLTKSHTLSDSDVSDKIGNVEFNKVHGRDAYLVYLDDALAGQLTRLGSDDKWTITIEGKKIAREFTSAVAGREFAFGYFTGQATKS